MPSGNSCTQAQVRHMLAMYKEKSSYSYVARACSVSRATVKRYVERGDPLRGILPFKIYLATQQLEETVEYTEEEANIVAKDHIRRLDRVIELMANRAETELSKPDSKFTIRGTDLAKAMQIRMQIVSVYRPWKIFKRKSTTTRTEMTAELKGRSHTELYFFEENDRWPTKEELHELESLEAARANVLPPPDPRTEQWPKENEEDGTISQGTKESDPAVGSEATSA